MGAMSTDSVIRSIVWRDDKQACDLDVRKRYSIQPGAVVQVRAL